LFVKKTLFDLLTGKNMWHIKYIKIKSVELDFRSSDQGLREVIAIYSDDLCIFNAINLIDFKMDATQIIVCESCGFSGCEIGGWVTFRRIGESILCIPAWSKMEFNREEGNEYYPPKFIKKRGPILMNGSVWEKLREYNKSMPEIEEIQCLNSLDAVRIIQSSAPGEIIGVFPSKPKLYSENVLSVTEGEFNEVINIIDAVLDKYYSDPVELDVVKESIEFNKIGVFVDLPGTPIWEVIAHNNDELVLLLGDLIVRPLLD
jgi:hypothetical protein